MTAERGRLGRIPRTATMAVLMLPILAGCANLPFDKPPPRLFVITAKNDYPADLPKVKWHMTVDVPVAPASLNTSRIAALRTPISLDYFGDASWADTAPRMIQTLLIESFENSGRILGIGRQSVTLRADYSLVTELRAFQAELRDGEPPDVHVRLNAKIVSFPQRTIIASTSQEKITRAASSQIEDVIRAFDESLGSVLKEIVIWALQAVPPEARSSPSP